MYKITLALSLFATLALAQSKDELFSLSLEELLNIEISTASRYSERAIDSPANIFIFTKEMIRERNYQSVEDILQVLPSVDIQKFSRSLAYGDVTMRGSNGNNKFLILVDGVRISTPAGSTISISHNYPIYHAAQVEVLLGAASVTYGADAFLGVINIITEKSESINELSAVAGTDNYLNSFANIAYAISEDVHVNAFISGYQSQSYKFDENYPELYPNPTPSTVENGYNFAPTQSINFFADITSKYIDVGVNHFENQASLDFNVKADASTFDTTAMDKDRLSTIYTKLHFDVTDSLNSETLLSYSRFEKDNQTYFKNKYSNFDKGYKYASSDRVSLIQDFTYKPNSKHTLSLGLAYDNFNVTPRGTDLLKPYDTSKSPTQQNLQYINTTIDIDFLAYSYENYALYLQENYEISDDVRFVAGLRYDVNTLYGDTFNPRLSLIYNASSQDIIKVMYAKSYLAPAADQIYNEYGAFGAKNSDGLYESYFFNLANSELKAEDLQSIEINYEHFFDDGAHIKFAPYISKIDGAITSHFTPNANDTTSIEGAILYNTQTFINETVSILYGLDISIQKDIIWGKSTFKNWVNLSYNSGYNKNDDVTSELAQVAQYKLKAGSTYIYDNYFYLTPKAFWISNTTSNSFEDTNRENRVNVPSYFLMDMSLQVKVYKELFITADVYNIFDHRYFSAPFAPNSRNTLDAAPQPSRLITAGLYYKF